MRLASTVRWLLLPGCLWLLPAAADAPLDGGLDAGSAQEQSENSRDEALLRELELLEALDVLRDLELLEAVDDEG